MADHEADSSQSRQALERRVAELTAELEAANQVLESFTYSVSHDLRAPLRAIGGFTDMLVRGIGARCDAESRDLLERVALNVGRMTALIDDLLEFSRVGRAGLNPAPFSLEDLAREVTGELCECYPRSQVRIASLVRVLGDRAMMRQALVHLIGNALKFSARRDFPVVEIGQTALDGAVVFYVRDNGAGFDMRYAERLFGLFQRMHRSDEFEGTGVGLSVVRQAIERHGGRVWAEAALDQGATFYFTLPLAGKQD
jgi:light-regulated signal transduction histidine kinase (bacteriophytochrome)